MARLPNPGGDTGTWGGILNDFLSQIHNVDGTLKTNSVATASIIDGNVTEAKLSTALQSKVNATAPVTSVAGKTGAVTLVKADVGLANVDNTSDLNKPISTATQTALDTKANTSALAPVATSGSYNDLTNKPSVAGAYVYYDDATTSWPGTRPTAETVIYIGGDEAHPPTTGVVNKDLWIRQASV